MRQGIVIVVIGLLIVATGGCSYLFYPNAKDFAEKAKGSNQVDTLFYQSDHDDQGPAQRRLSEQQGVQ